MRRETRMVVALLALQAACDGEEGPRAPSDLADSGAVVGEVPSGQVMRDASAQSALDATLSSPDASDTKAVLPTERDGKRLFAVRFDLRAGDQPFGCGTFAELGTNKTRVQPLDARMYVHDVALVRTNGERVALELVQDGRYQRENVALIDFADDTGQCATNHSERNTAVYGYAAPGSDYTGIAFKVGIPEDKNHLDGALAPAPYNATGMWWSWSGGYKYIRLDLTSDVQPIWYFHAGAAGCSGTTVTGFACSARQIADVQLLGFDPNLSQVVFDVAQFYASSDLSHADALPGCMGGKDDADCAPLFAALGVNVWDDVSPRPEQTAFRLIQGEPWLPPALDGAPPSRRDPSLWPQADYVRPPVLDRTNISVAGTSESHEVDDPRHGANCMRCHQSHGPGAGRFTAAGSVFDHTGKPAVGTKVEIFSGTADRVNHTFTDVTRFALLDVDDNGNFFTTEPLPYDTTKLTARVVGVDERPLATMFSSKQTGACNTCHTGGFRITLPAPQP